LKIELIEVLREIYVEPSREAVEPALQYRYLLYMVQRYLDMLGERGTIALLKTFENPVKPVVRTNTVLIGPGDLRRRLEMLGFKLEPIPWSKESFWMVEAPESPSIGATHEYLKGLYYVHRDATSPIPVYF
jgi:16S rRNA C967 or C1407 C5-methylase (RsmB/RsmF family)